MPELGTTPIEKILLDPAYVPLQTSKQVKNNLGGHWNHTFFWELMTPGGAKEPGGELKSAIEGTCRQHRRSSRSRFNEAGAARFGSGWAWLIVNKDKKLEIITTANQDTPIEPGRPVLGVDVWEHAYYLKYQNRRAGLSEGLVEYRELGQGRGEFQESRGHPGVIAIATARCRSSGPPDPMMRAVQPCGGHLRTARSTDQGRATGNSGSASGRVPKVSRPRRCR